MVEFFIIAKGYSFELFEHIGIGYIKSYLKRNGVDSNINLILPNEKEELYNILENKKPLVVGFVVYSFNALEIKEASRIVKMCLPNTHITVGGPATLNCTKEILDMLPDVDSVIEGEGEYTFLELVNLIKQEKELSGCQGLTFRKGKEIVINSSRPLINNLDSLPFPARDIFEKYPSSYIRIIGSRGCSGHCTFCVYGGAAAKGIQKGERVRFRSAVNIVDEMEELVEKYGVRSFYFIDDTFIEEKYVKGIEKVEGIIEEVTRRKLDITFAIQTRPQSIARNEKVREYIKRLQKIGEIQKYLSSSDLTLVSFTNISSPIKLQCKNCEHEWTVRYSTLMKKIPDCPKCKVHRSREKNPFISEQDRKKLRADNYYEKILRKSNHTIVAINYTGSKDDVDAICVNCGYKWTTRADHLVDRCWCPKCKKEKTSASI